MRLLFGDFSLRNTNDSEDIQAKAERYFDSLKATKQIKEVSELINDTTKLIDSGFFEGGQDFLTVDDFIRHFEDFKPIYKASMSPRGYEVASKFMSKISKRYDLSDWLACFNKDDFGVVIEKPYCISSINTNANSLQKTFNELINFINNEFQVQVNNDLQITVPVVVRNVRGQEALNEVLANISNNILVKNLNLKTIQNNDIQLSVQVLGSKIDFRKIMIANEEFDHSPDDEDRIALSFIYKKRI